MNKSAIAKRERDDGARYVLLSPSCWGEDLFFRRKGMADAVLAYRGVGEVMEINEYIRRLE